MPRYVVLEHHWEGVHWDFMLEEGQVLRTWALEQAPAPGKRIPARQLPDHRLAYLDYEGPVSRNRGHVRRWDRGEYEGSLSETEVRVRLRGGRLAGEVYLSKLEGETWEFIWSPVDAA